MQVPRPEEVPYVVASLAKTVEDLEKALEVVGRMDERIKAMEGRQDERHREGTARLDRFDRRLTTNTAALWGLVATLLGGIIVYVATTGIGP